MNSTVTRQPEIEVLGLYSPSANAERYELFVRAYVDSFDPAHYSSHTIAMFQRLGRAANLTPLTESERQDFEGIIRNNLGNAAYVEVLIRNASAAIDPGDFRQPDPNLDEGLWQVAWNETYLSEDGESVIAGYPRPSVPEASTLRIVFAIHHWKPDLPLVYSCRELACPPMRPLPNRLWRLVPYEMPD